MRKYPYFGLLTQQVGDDEFRAIVLFTRHGRGIVIASEFDGLYNIGDVSDNWDEDYFDSIPNPAERFLDSISVNILLYKYRT